MAERAIKDRYGLLQRGLFPEVLPPCFTSVDLKRSFVGLVRKLKAKELHQKRHSDYIRYNGTKHDGSRRYYGTPNPISYFYVADFIAAHWADFDQRFSESPFSVSRPKVGADTDDRSIIMQSLSELTTTASRQLGYAGYVLRADVAQFFPSIYTHTISWSAHGVDEAKRDSKTDSSTNYFNKLDFFVRNCQLNESRGVLVGPDGFRLIAEYLMAGLDKELQEKISGSVVGAARHVDDYYLGLKGEAEALAALSALRDVLERYSLHVNDAKTRIMPGVEPLNDLWAQALRHDARDLLGDVFGHTDQDDIILFLNKSLSLAMEIKSDSPIKIALRTLDQNKIYKSSTWEVIEPYLQRAIFHHPHAIDYAALLVVKRKALGRSIDAEGWKNTAYDLLRRHLALNHHHEIVWLLLLLISTGIEVSEQLATELAKNNNAHVRAMIVAAYQDKRITRKPKLALGDKLASADANWLVNSVARSTEFGKAAFSGALAEEFEHLAAKRVRLIDFKTYLKDAASQKEAISRTCYGYDAEKIRPVNSFEIENDDDDDDLDVDDDIDAQFADRLRRDNT